MKPTYSNQANDFIELWEDIEEDDPLPDEIAIFDEYHASK